MKNFQSIFVYCMILLFARWAVTAQQESHQDWLFKRIKETEAVTAHMPLEDLLKVFKPVGSFGKLERHALKSCDLIVVDVIFGTSALETGSHPPDKSIPISMITQPFLVSSKSVTTAPSSGSHEAWLLEKIREVEAVKPGITRAAFEKLFGSAVSFGDGTKFALIGGSFITVDVSFTNLTTRKASKDNPTNQKLATISPPYLFYSFAIDWYCQASPTRSVVCLWASNISSVSTTSRFRRHEFTIRRQRFTISH